MYRYDEGEHATEQQHEVHAEEHAHALLYCMNSVAPLRFVSKRMQARSHAKGAGAP